MRHGIGISLALAAALGTSITHTHGTARAADSTPATPPAQAANGTNATVKTWTLEECLATAMATNRRRPASRFALVMAEAQHRQALSAYWPQVTASAAYQRLDESPNFVFPAGQMYIPAQSVSVPGGMANVTIPANAFAPGFPPQNVQLPVAYPGQTINTPAQVFPIPEQDVKLMDPNSFVTSANLTWLLFDGGMRKGMREQAKGGIEAAKEEMRRTDLDLTDSVKRMYYGAVLSRQLRQLGSDTLARMEATLNLTESMYKDGAGKVKKTDFLDNKVMVESLRSAVAALEKNEEMSKAALAVTMGLQWNSSIQPAVSEIPFDAQAASLEQLVSTSYQFNPDWGKLEAGLRAAEGALKTAKSGHYPKVALTGELHRWWNDYDAGLSTTENKEGWTVGVGIELPLFDGFLTRGRVGEATARLAQLREQQILLREGLGIQIRDLVLGLSATAKSYQATLDAMKASEESRDLNTRAYQNELVETEKVIRAQLLEALMTAQHYKTRYDFVALRSQLDLVVGSAVLKQLSEHP